MPVTTLTSRQFDQVRRTREAAQSGPVVITSRGRPAFVLLSIEDYNGLCQRKPNIGDVLSNSEADEIYLEPPA